jgi:hypothetical protein
MKDCKFWASITDDSGGGGGGVGSGGGGGGGSHPKAFVYVYPRAQPVKQDTMVSRTEHTERYGLFVGSKQEHTQSTTEPTEMCTTSIDSTTSTHENKTRKNTIVEQSDVHTRNRTTGNSDTHTHTRNEQMSSTDSMNNTDANTRHLSRQTIVDGFKMKL